MTHQQACNICVRVCKLRIWTFSRQHGTASCPDQHN